jgi:hypothetical protein
VRSWLILNTPWEGTGNRSDWSFSGADEARLRECLDQLGEFVAPNPEDRWTAAVVHGFSDTGRPATPKQAWTIEGALALAELLPDALSDLRDDLLKCFSRRAEGWHGDAHTPPRHAG